MHHARHERQYQQQPRQRYPVRPIQCLYHIVGPFCAYSITAGSLNLNRHLVFDVGEAAGSGAGCWRREEYQKGAKVMADLAGV
jgi:hypothetical protein